MEAINGGGGMGLAALPWKANPGERGNSPWVRGLGKVVSCSCLAATVGQAVPEEHYALHSGMVRGEMDEELGLQHSSL